MSPRVSGWVVLAVLGVVGGALRLLASEVVRHRWPRQYAWLTDYRGLTLRWTVLSVAMLGAAIFVVVMALETTKSSNRNFLWVAAAILTVIAVAFADQGRRALRQATLEGRRRRFSSR